MNVIIAIVLTIAIILGFVYLADRFYFIRKIYEKVDKHFSTGGLLFALFIPLVIATSFTSIPYEYSNGTKGGSLTKFTQKGLIFKTWEGQLNLGGMVTNGDGGMVANVWNFSVTDPAIISKLQKAKGRVELDYSQKLLVPINQGSTSYKIIGMR